MPKGKRKGKYYEGRKEVNNSSSEDESVNDNASECSIQSDLRSVQDDAGAEEEQTDTFEEKLSDALDGAQQKSSSGRASSLEAVCVALGRRSVPDFVASNKGTLADCIERSLRKGRGAEQLSAAKLAPVVCLQLCDCDYTFGEEFSKEISPALLAVALDKSTATANRAQACSTLSLVSVLVGEDLGNILEYMRAFESIFSGSYLKGDGSINISVPAEIGVVHGAALDAWALLLGLWPGTDVSNMLGDDANKLGPSMRNLIGLLSAPSLDVRTAAGGCIALAFELGREHDDEFCSEHLETIAATVEQLATDSNKYRAKKDRKAQRATFRDILHYLEEEEVVAERIRVGGECVSLDSWASRARYDALAAALGGALQALSRASPVLRAALHLPPPQLPSGKPLPRPNKRERHLQNAAAFKARTISRAKNRDKRSAVIVS